MVRGATSSRAVVQVCGLASGSGSTSVAVGLALAACGRGLEVLLIDANVHHPGVARALEMEEAEGISEAVVEGRPVADVRHRSDRAEGLHVVPAGRAGLDHPDLAVVDALSALVASRRPPVDLVIVDTAPFQLDGDALAVANLVDGAVIVVDEGRRRGRQLQSALDLLGVAGGRCLGAVITAPDRRVVRGKAASTVVRRRPVVGSAWHGAVRVQEAPASETAGPHLRGHGR
jgi:receptor protein-tyrosine kinase